ncbi:DUF421 domain-containing protein [Halalkalibacter krulwichiae]|uniref:DUF421 domain-containing protein n=1 Tax=Halalkalibacter krulwichiae TaxID=199441 RepID=A0A1X9MGG7_9BACI|nr:DUF421 domain-containing protein [Halalkalibacter krulwichiae]ARK32569.1 hypothetical protein BkAM31D_23360 [Halalkalibacter krulwichiae]
MVEIGEVVIRTVVAFSFLIIAARFLGKQVISQMTIFDFIAAITLGGLTAGLAYNTSIQPHNTVVAFIMFVVIIFLIAVLSTRNRKIRKIFAGDPTIVIQNGKILEENMRKMRYTLDYLNQQLREKDIFNINEVLFAIIETNGSLTVQKKPQFRNVTRQELMLATNEEPKLPIELIMDSEVIDKNLVENDLTQSWLNAELQKRNVDMKDVFYAVLLGNGIVYIDTYKDHILSPIDKE